MVWERWPWIGRTEGDIHAKNNQERSAGKAHVGNGLENKSFPLKDQKTTHNLECDQRLGSLTIRKRGISVGKETRK
jgi:hypothetical protein